MKPPSFTHHACRTVDEAVELLGSTEDAKVISGGQSLVPMMNLRLANPSDLVDLNTIAGLDSIDAGPAAVTVGATARQHTVEKSTAVASAAPLIAAALGHVGHPQIRNRGTIVGSLCHADPAAEMPAVFATLGGSITAQGPRGTRTIDASDFFDSYLTTALEPNEIATSVTFETPNGGTGWSFEEVARRHGDFAIIGVTTLVTLAEDVISEARVTVFGGGTTPQRIGAAEQLLAGTAVNDVNDDLLEAGAGAVSGALTPGSDIHGSAEYRRHVAGVLFSRGIRTAIERAAA